jgi:hypothetical protein
VAFCYNISDIITRQSQFATQSAGDMAQHLTQSLRDAGDMDIAQPDVFTESAILFTTLTMSDFLQC